MSGGGWSTAYASVTGSSHVRREQPCQDRSACRAISLPGGSSVLVAVVSDGAGSANHSAAGAQMVCESWISALDTAINGGGGIESITHEFALNWLNSTRETIRAAADATDVEPRQFACTCLAAAVGPESAVYLQIGDGAIVVSPADDPCTHEPVWWPMTGEYEGMTWFVTDDDALEICRFAMDRRAIGSLALLTDGLQRLALHYESGTAHEPFFRAIFRPLEAEPPPAPGRLNALLAAYLNSPGVNARTDDDKSLVLALRTSVLPAPPPEDLEDVPADTEAV